MRHSHIAPTPRASLLAGFVCLALAGCVPAPPAPTPAPSPIPVPTPAPTPIATPSPVPTFSSWMDVPATPGDWSYVGGVARFGEPASGARLTLRCDRAAGAVEIARAGTAAAPLEMVIRTEAMERGVAATAGGAEPLSIIARVPARDPLLDAMAFSKGRFAIEMGGVETLYLPAWPEVTRVIEDCR